jgi:hypothetical protein
MHEIESRVRLPPAAHPLRDYARYYAMKGHVVWAVYTVPGPPLSGQESCKEMDAAAPPEKWRTIECQKETPGDSYLAAGQRRWMSDFRAIPLTPDAECEQVTFSFDPRNRTLTRPACERSMVP